MPYTNQPLHLMVVEDNPGDLYLFEAYLRQTRLVVGSLRPAASLKQAADLSHQPIDLAFLDLSLPDSSGLESFVRLQQLLPRAPIIVLSGLADEATALKCIGQGAQDYLLKDDLNEKLLEKAVVYSIERTKNLGKIEDINRQYELIGSITNDIIWTWDLAAGTITARKASFFDYGAGEVGAGLDWWFDKVHPADKDKVQMVICGVKEGTLENLQVEYRFRCKSGSYRYVFNRGVLLRNEAGAPCQMIGAMMDITEGKELQEELLRAQVHLQKQIAEAALLGQESEKESIGKELHDNINQVLASAKLYLEVAGSHPELKDEMIYRGRNNLVHAMDEIRRLSHSLIPPSLEDHSLLDSVKELTGELERAGAFAARVAAEHLEEALLDDSKKLMLYRVVQEALNNVVKYAHATVVTITFSVAEGKLRMEISDNGTGFDTTKKPRGVGLRNIESRVAYYAGTVTLSSAIGKGTTLRVVMPV